MVNNRAEATANGRDVTGSVQGSGIRQCLLLFKIMDRAQMVSLLWRKTCLAKWVSPSVVSVVVNLFGAGACLINVENIGSALVAGGIQTRLHTDLRIAGFLDDVCARVLDQFMSVSDFSF